VSTALVVSAYLVLAVLANWNAWTTGGATALQPSQDPKLDAWTMAWTPFALTHAVDPLFSHWVNVPYGANYAANVAIPLLALIASPVTALWGPVAGTNFLISFAFFTSAVAGYCFVRHWTSWRPAAFFAGLLFGFSPFMVAAGNSHIHIMFVALVPFIFILLDEIVVRQRYSPILLGVVLGLLLVAQYFISSEILAAAAVMSLIAVVLVALCNLRRLRDHLTFAVPALATALGIAVVVLAYPIWYSVRGPEHYSLSIPAGHYQADLLSAVLPTSNQLIAPAGSVAISDQFAGNLSENGSYLGIPLVLLLVASVAMCRRSKVVVIAFVLTVSAYVLSLGSPLLIANHNTALRMPGGAFHHLPLLEGAVLGRFSVFVDLFAALIFGIALQKVRSWPGWPSRWTGVLIALVVSGAVLVPLLPSLPYTETSTDTPSFFTTSAVDSVPDGSVAVVYPPTTPANADAMLWQASAAMRFKMPGAYALVPIPGTGQSEWGSQTLTTNTLQQLGSGAQVPETAAIRHALRQQWREWNVQTFIMGPGGDQAMARAFVSWVIGRQPVRTHGVDVWHGVDRAVDAR